MAQLKDPASELEAASRDLEEAEFAIEHDRSRPAAVFAYYAAFRAAQARIAVAKREAKSHHSGKRPVSPRAAPSERVATVSIHDAASERR